MPTIKIALLFCLCFFTAISYALDDANIQVSGSAIIEAMPDYADVYVILEGREKTKALAQSKTDASLNKLITTLASFSIGKKDIDASAVSSYSNIEWQDGKSRKAGETVRHTIKVSVHNLQQLADIYKALNELDISRLQTAQYQFTDIAKLQNQALQNALVDARNKADVIAASIGKKIKTVQQVIANEHNNNGMFRETSMLSASQDNFNSSEYMQVKPQSIHASVHVTYLMH